MPTRNPRRITCLALALITIPLGIACRMAPLGLPALVVKFGGSALWAVMVYWLIAAGFPRRSNRWLALIASCVAVAVEFFKLVQTPPLDAFRLTPAGKLLLGRFFSGWDIAAYLLAIAAVALLDEAFLRVTLQSEPPTPSTPPR